MAHLIDALQGYADLAEFQQRRGRGEACFAVPQSKYCSTLFAQLKQLTTQTRSSDWRKLEVQARQQRTPFGPKETQLMPDTMSCDKDYLAHSSCLLFLTKI